MDGVAGGEGGPVDEGGAPDVQFGGDAFAVGLHGVFRQAKVFGDLPVRPALAEHFKNLLFAIGEFLQQGRPGFGGLHSPGGEQEIDLIQKDCIGLGLVDDGMNGVLKVGRANKGVGVTGEHDDFGIGIHGKKLAGHGHTAAIRQLEVEDQQIRTMAPTLLQALVRSGTGGDQFQTFDGTENSLEKLGEHFLVLDQDGLQTHLYSLDQLH